jgi:hypothetical protein
MFHGGSIRTWPDVEALKGALGCDYNTAGGPRRRGETSEAVSAVDALSLFSVDGLRGFGWVLLAFVRAEFAMY